jgi:membrane protein YqaA with SNARE-associated domain
VGQALGLLGVAFASALLPFVNIEVYLVGLVTLSGHGHVFPSGHLWLLAAVAALGQMLGKLIWYYLGRNSLHWRWVRRQLDKPKAHARLERWRRRVHEWPVVDGLLVFVSGVTGFPPFAIVAVVAGQLDMGVCEFFLVGLASRLLRFAAILGGAGWISHFVPGL